ncbi:MAG: VOC family protein [Alphaproteobacteria bacterium]|nr:VOC family protein [Alphaproteobacteria bacterium]MDP6566918.1 VOC family protein [Alphaproteobacteria bacterium]MDP6813274.1 VOC family protein [Alphaproteobacteria bacterium]
MDLAKPHIDVGLYTNRREEQLAFWQGPVGLEFDHLGKLGGGVHQLRHHMNGSIMKVNHARDPLPELPPSGYRRLLIARDGLRAVEELTDPDGNAVALVPPGHRGVQGIGLELSVRDLAAARDFWLRAMQFEDAGDDAVRCGDSLLFLAEDGSRAAVPDAMAATGYRYTTVQIFKCDAEHAGVLARGGREGRPPGTVGTTVRYSFVRDPDGNWIEVSQRAQLTGSLD